MDQASYRFRPATLNDLSLLRLWRSYPHMIEWWGPPEEDDIEEAIADPHTSAWIVEYDGRPFAYAQDYDPHAWPGHHFEHLPPGSRGIDQSIGEPDMLDQGHGSAFISQFCDGLFERGVPVIGTDPHPDNARAIRAYEKAGFEIVSEPLDTDWGLCLLMERRR
jgi:aminoglycoside 6'-N-acetyltransferase